MGHDHAINEGLTIAPATREAVSVAKISERASVTAVQARLNSKYPHFSPDEIAATVARVYARFDRSRIRDYVPLLVERRARAELASAPTAAL
jgi:hypothetical protein